MRNHATAVLACDFFVAISATFRMLYVFVVLHVGTRQILHWNVTEHPTAEWTAQQFRMVMSGDEPHRFLIHDHDSIYSDVVPVLQRHRIPDGHRAVAKPILGGLHHEYRLERVAA